MNMRQIVLCTITVLLLGFESGAMPPTLEGGENVPVLLLRAVSPAIDFASVSSSMNYGKLGIYLADACGGNVITGLEITVTRSYNGKVLRAPLRLNGRMSLDERINSIRAAFGDEIKISEFPVKNVPGGDLGALLYEIQKTPDDKKGVQTISMTQIGGIYLTFDDKKDQAGLLEGCVVIDSAYGARVPTKIIASMYPLEIIEAIKRCFGNEVRVIVKNPSICAN